MAPTNTSADENKKAAPLDPSIDYSAGLEYWKSIPSTVNGMLGMPGSFFPHIAKVDLQGSANFLSKLRRQHQYQIAPQATIPPGRTPLLPRAADCGAGIGRITRGLLVNVAAQVDVVEPVKRFTDELVVAPVVESMNMSAMIGAVGSVINLGLQDWTPEPGAYNLIWNQWCLGYLTDAQLVEYLRRCKDGLAAAVTGEDDNEKQGAFEGAWIVVKENMSTNPKAVDDYDELDSFVTRTDAKFRSLFKEAGLKVIATELQKGFPKALYPVRMYALKAK